MKTAIILVGAIISMNACQTKNSDNQINAQNKGKTETIEKQKIENLLSIDWFVASFNRFTNSCTGISFNFAIPTSLIILLVDKSCFLFYPNFWQTCMSHKK